MGVNTHCVPKQDNGNRISIGMLSSSSQFQQEDESEHNSCLDFAELCTKSADFRLAKKAFCKSNFFFRSD